MTSEQSQPTAHKNSDSYLFEALLMTVLVATVLEIASQIIERYVHVQMPSGLVILPGPKLLWTALNVIVALVVVVIGFLFLFSLGSKLAAKRHGLSTEEYWNEQEKLRKEERRREKVRELDSAVSQVEDVLSAGVVEGKVRREDGETVIRFQREEA